MAETLQVVLEITLALFKMGNPRDVGLRPCLKGLHE